jgi:ADP-ribose pyrophosphatase
MSRFRPLGRVTTGRGVFLRFDRIHLLGPEEGVALRDVVRHPGGVGVLPIHDGRVWLIRQYRVAVGRDVLEIPAGKLDRGEDPEVAARRELEEELGLIATHLTRLGAMLPSPGYTDEVIHLYAANGIVPGGRSPDGVEEHAAEVVSLEFDELLAMIDRGEVLDGKTQLAASLWLRRSR